MKTIMRALACGVLVVTPILAWADSWAPPRPKMFASHYGQFAFKVLPPEDFGGPARGIFFYLDDNGKEKALWDQKLVNTPYRALVADTGKNVVTIDTYASLGGKHSLVVYDAKGKVLADFALEGLFTDAEITKHVKRTAGSRWWAGDASFACTGNQLVVTMTWGKTTRISLESGKVMTEEKK